MMKRSTRWLGLMVVSGALVYACANPSQPIGGPPDTAAPKLLRVTPSTGTIGAKPKSIEFQFDEVVSEVPKGMQSLDGLVFISPRSGLTQVDWDRTRLQIRPKNGWKVNTVYTVLLSAGVTDLRGNAIDTSTRVVFSTGGEIPPTKLTGVVFDWTGGRYAPNSIVEAISKDLFPKDTGKTAPKDSTIYQTIADSLGRFTLEHIPAGNYVVRAIVDNNKNRSVDRMEPWDTASMTITAGYALDLYAFPHDTLGLRINAAIPMDTNTVLKVGFDKSISPTQTFPNTQFVLRKIVKNDTTLVEIKQVLTAPQKALIDSLRRIAVQDSMMKSRPAPKPDTSLAARTQRDSIARARARDSLARIEQQRLEEDRMRRMRGGKALPPKDTTPKPKMKRAPLFSDVYVILEKPLDYSTVYSIEARPVRSISGYAKQTRHYDFRTEAKPKEQDKKAPGDTTESKEVPIKK